MYICNMTYCMLVYVLRITSNNQICYVLKEMKHQETFHIIITVHLHESNEKKLNQLMHKLSHLYCSVLITCI
jgi:uncharacterized OsmC-like protein